MIMNKCVVCCRLAPDSSFYCEKHGLDGEPSYMPVPFAEWFGVIAFIDDRFITNGKDWTILKGLHRK